MKANELITLLRDGALTKYATLYDDLGHATERIIDSINAFVKNYGDDRDIEIFSVPGRSEIIGNHTDHNHGKVMAGAITRDILAVVSKNDEDVIRFCSEGYSKDQIKISDVTQPENFRKFSSRALVAGMTNAFIDAGHKVGGYDAYSCTEVLKGSGLSSSAAFEVMIGNILNHLYNDGCVDNKEIAKYAQYSENVYFGKPCGLMDQMACAVGGFVYIDFESNRDPVVESVDFSLADAGYSLCIVNTGGSHAGLNDDYAAVPAEMKAVAAYLGKDVLRGLTEEDIIKAIPMLRKRSGDRAILRAIHFIRENDRVEGARNALKSGDLDAFYQIILASGRSSYQYLQNVYTNANPFEQGIALALCIADGALCGKGGAYRVHGGGFAGTIQAFVKNEELPAFIEKMNSVFGEGSAVALNIRPLGAVKLF
ncbi:MAG: galactokinase [Clostridia bacterium]|nr:galactokinase [Clostridia bacterium]